MTPYIIICHRTEPSNILKRCRQRLTLVIVLIGRQEALLLFSDPNTARHVLSLNINGIGGFYLSRCDIHKHAYLVSEQNMAGNWDEPSSSQESQTLLSPIYVDNGPIISEEDNLVDLEVESTTGKEPVVPSELLVGYAQIFATLYIAIEKFASIFANRLDRP